MKSREQRHLEEKLRLYSQRRFDPSAIERRVEVMWTAMFRSDPAQREISEEFARRMTELPYVPRDHHLEMFQLLRRGR